MVQLNGSGPGVVPHPHHLPPRPTSRGTRNPPKDGAPPSENRGAGIPHSRYYTRHPRRTHLEGAARRDPVGGEERGLPPVQRRTPSPKCRAESPVSIASTRASEAPSRRRHRQNGGNNATFGGAKDPPPPPNTLQSPSTLRWLRKLKCGLGPNAEAIVEGGRVCLRRFFKAFESGNVGIFFSWWGEVWFPKGNPLEHNQKITRSKRPCTQGGSKCFSFFLFSSSS